MNIRERIMQGRLFFDGGSGTILQGYGLAPGELPENWNLSHPEIIKDLHKAYLEAGSNIITTTTFGANRLKFKDNLEEIIAAALSNAKRAVDEVGLADTYIALDIGPLGKLLKPMGDLEFEEAVSIFAETVRLGAKYGADLVIIETMNDSYETKAAVLAAKENCDLPIFATNAYDASGKLMTGASPEAMVALLEGLGVDALGINCSLGPDAMLPVVHKLLACASVPVIVNPNAGLPVLKDGKTEFNIGPEEFAKTMKEIAKAGALILGGCCGTTPDYIRATKEAVADVPVPFVTPKNKTVISSYSHAVSFENKPILIGERINPTGKKKLKEALREQNYDYILQEAIGQQEAGAEVLDVNVGLPEIDEIEMLTQSVERIQAVTDLPLQIDTADPAAMESALRVYNGKPLINSVNGKQEVMDAVFPLAKKYGGVIIALTLDESGIPETAEGRIKIAETIAAEAEKYGLTKHDLIIDPLAMTVSSDPKAALVTLETIEILSKRGFKTSLGVSNVSFGLPERNMINGTFFTMAMQSGLSAAILNPHSAEMMNAYHSFCALADLDSRFENYIAYASGKEAETPVAETAEKTPMETLRRAILKGLQEEAATAARAALQSEKPLTVIDQAVIPALDEIGQKFEQKTAFLPQLLMSAEAAKAAFIVIKEILSKGGEQRDKKFKIVLATVRGDIHDIGKNIVKVLLENYDFDVIDLGKDVAPEIVVKTAKEQGARLVALSALMTTTVPAMEETTKLLQAEYPSCKVAVGGAVLTQSYADMIGADFYGKDAMSLVRYAESLCS